MPRMGMALSIRVDFQEPRITLMPRMGMACFLIRAIRAIRGLISRAFFARR